MAMFYGAVENRTVDALNAVAPSAPPEDLQRLLSAPTVPSSNIINRDPMMSPLLSSRYRERFHRLAAVRSHRCARLLSPLRLCRSFGGVVVVSCGCGVWWCVLVGGWLVVEVVDGGRALLR